MDTQAIETAFEELTLQLKETLGRQPDLQSVLFLVGVQELGQLNRAFSKEEKQDLMHVGVCQLLTNAGYFTRTTRDADGWPHYEAVKNMPIDTKNLAAQETLLKEQAIQYFNSTPS
jgi:hypothetical protein